MTASAENMNELNIDEIFNGLIKNALNDIVVKQLGSSKHKLWIENGSNKGRFCEKKFFS